MPWMDPMGDFSGFGSLRTNFILWSIRQLRGPWWLVCFTRGGALGRCIVTWRHWWGGEAPHRKVFNLCFTAFVVFFSGFKVLWESGGFKVYSCITWNRQKILPCSSKWPSPKMEVNPWKGQTPNPPWPDVGATQGPYRNRMPLFILYIL